MKTIEVDIYVVVRLHHKSSLAAEGGDPEVAHHCLVGEVSVGWKISKWVSLFRFTCMCLQSRPE